MPPDAVDLLLRTLRFHQAQDGDELRSSWSGVQTRGLPELVQYERSSLWLHRRLADLGLLYAVDPTLTSFLRERARWITAQNLRVEAQLDAIVRFLNARAVPHVPDRSGPVTRKRRPHHMIDDAGLLRLAEEGQIMGMPAMPEPVTSIEELLALPEDGMRHELLDGEHVVTPAPSFNHQRAVKEFVRALDADIGDQDEVEWLTSPADIILGPRTLVQPDLFITVQKSSKAVKSWTDVGTPRIAIEILSPSTAARDRNQKRRLYLEAGVEEYWIVDVDARVVERWRHGDERPEIMDGELRWSLECRASGVIQLPAVFERILR